MVFTVSGASCVVSACATNSAVLRVTNAFAHQLRLPLGERDQRLLMIAPNDGVGLPVAQPRPERDDSRALFDAAAGGDLAAPVAPPGVALAPLLLRTQVAIERAALSFVSIDVLIDTLVADRRLPLLCEAASELVRTPVLA